MKTVFSAPGESEFSEPLSLTPGGKGARKGKTASAQGGARCRKKQKSSKPVITKKVVKSAKKEYKCSICNRICRGNSSLMTHMRTHTGEKPFMCDLCGISFATMGALKTHRERLHNQNRTARMYKKRKERKNVRSRTELKCSHCAQTCFGKAALIIHMRTHTGEKPYICNICGKTFATKSNWKGHTKYHETADVVKKGRKKREYNCRFCEKTFSGNGKLTNHENTHTGEKPYMCDICGTKFAQASNLKTHTKSHTGFKGIQCTICHKVLTQNKHLTSHMRSHTGEKPYECTVCGKTFSSSSNYSNHRKIHTTERQYTCEICGQTMITAYKLSVHKMSHTGNKPYKCDVCLITFYWRSVYLRHMNENHPGDRAQTGPLKHPDDPVEAMV